MTKELFVEMMNAIDEQHQHDLKCQEAYLVIYPQGFLPLYDNNILKNALTNLLKVLMADEDWIEYYMWELDFGRKYYEGCVTEKDGTPINISTPDLLWEFLVNNK